MFGKNPSRRTWVRHVLNFPGASELQGSFRQVPTRGSQRICPSVLGLRAAGCLSLWAGLSVWDSPPEGTGQVRGPPPEKGLGPQDQPPPRLPQQGHKSPKQDHRRLCPAGRVSGLPSGPVCNCKPRGARAQAGLRLVRNNPGPRPRGPVGGGHGPRLWGAVVSTGDVDCSPWGGVSWWGGGVLEA